MRSLLSELPLDSLDAGSAFIRRLLDFHLFLVASFRLAPSQDGRLASSQDVFCSFGRWLSLILELLLARLRGDVWRRSASVLIAVLMNAGGCRGVSHGRCDGMTREPDRQASDKQALLIVVKIIQSFRLHPVSAL